MFYQKSTLIEVSVLFIVSFGTLSTQTPIEDAKRNKENIDGEILSPEEIDEREENTSKNLTGAEYEFEANVYTSTKGFQCIENFGNATGFRVWWPSLERCVDLTLEKDVCLYNGWAFVDKNTLEGHCGCPDGLYSVLNKPGCHKPYTRGPCDLGDLISYGGDQEKAVCSKDLCAKENTGRTEEDPSRYVPLLGNGTCYQLGSSDPCPKYPYIIGIDYFHPYVERSTVHFVKTLPRCERRFEHDDAKFLCFFTEDIAQCMFLPKRLKGDQNNSTKEYSKYGKKNCDGLPLLSLKGVNHVALRKSNLNISKVGISVWWPSLNRCVDIINEWDICGSGEPSLTVFDEGSYFGHCNCKHKEAALQNIQGCHRHRLQGPCEDGLVVGVDQDDITSLYKCAKDPCEKENAPFDTDSPFRYFSLYGEGCIKTDVQKFFASQPSDPYAGLAVRPSCITSKEEYTCRLKVKIYLSDRKSVQFY